MRRTVQVGSLARQVGISLFVAALAVGGAEGQVVQLARSLDTPEATLAVSWKKQKLLQAVGFWTRRLETDRSSLDSTQAAHLRGLVELATEALVIDDETGLASRFEALRALEKVTLGGAVSALETDFGHEDAPGFMPARPDPTPHLLVPDVVFGLGAGWERHDSENALDVGLGTNLLGAGVGTALGALGADQLKQYILDNMVVGFSVPAGRSVHLTGQLSLGLGRLTLPHDRVVWATLNLDQMQRADVRVPREAVQADTAARLWTNPTLSLGYSFWSLAATKARIQAGKATPTLTFGISPPHYFPDNVLKTLVGLFTDDLKKFVRAGKVRFSVAVYLPLFPFKPVRRQS